MHITHVALLHIEDGWLIIPLIEMISFSDQKREIFD